LLGKGGGQRSGSLRAWPTGSRLSTASTHFERGAANAELPPAPRSSRCPGPNRTKLTTAHPSFGSSLRGTSRKGRRPGAPSERPTGSSCSRSRKRTASPRPITPYFRVALRKGEGLAGFAARGDLPDAIVERRLRRKVLMTLEQPRALVHSGRKPPPSGVTEPCGLSDMGDMKALLLATFRHVAPWGATSMKVWGLSPEFKYRRPRWTEKPR
jgi:hypothetical protein